MWRQFRDSTWLTAGNLQEKTREGDNKTWSSCPESNWKPSAYKAQICLFLNHFHQKTFCDKYRNDAHFSVYFRWFISGHFRESPRTHCPKFVPRIHSKSWEKPQNRFRAQKSSFLAFRPTSDQGGLCPLFFSALLPTAWKRKGHLPSGIDQEFPEPIPLS